MSCQHSEGADPRRQGVCVKCGHPLPEESGRPIPKAPRVQRQLVLVRDGWRLLPRVVDVVVDS